MLKCWCPYCGEPHREDNLERSWRFHSSRGGAYFVARIYKCHKCGKRVRITEKETKVEHSSNFRDEDLE